MNNKGRKRKGQNVIEYVLLVVAVLIVLILFLQKDGSYHNAIKHGLFDGTVNQISVLSNQIKLK